jgi:predicted glutamine amidotransferase
MFGIKGSSSSAVRLHESLIRAARSDSFSNKRIAHDDGWGGVWFSKDNQFLWRTTIPIFEDKMAMRFFPKTTQTITGLSHARKAAPNEPVRGPFDSHPFFTRVGENMIYVTHNGHIDKSKLKTRLGLDTNDLNDTEAFTFLIEKTKGTVESRLQTCIDLVYESGAMLGALNLIVLSMNRNGDHDLFYYSDFPEGKNDLYYSLYIDRNNRSNAVMSSTVAYHLGLIDQSGECVKQNAVKVPLRKLRKLG